MKLEGSLDTFSLPDILQLLAMTKKTGALRLTSSSAGTTGVVWVADGAVSAAASDLSRQALARRVVGAALVGDEALAAAVERARQESGVGVVRALLDAGALTEDAVVPIARQQVIDAVCDLLRWPEGDFAFYINEADPDALPITVTVEDLVAEGQRRLSAWPALTALIPSPATTLSLSVAPSSDPSCSREEWALLALVDGRRTVSSIVSLLGAGEYAVVRALAALVERGLLVTSDGGTAGTGGLADLERRQGLLAGLEGPAGVLPAPRSGSSSAASTPASADDDLQVAVSALSAEASDTGAVTAFVDAPTASVDVPAPAEAVATASTESARATASVDAIAAPAPADEQPVATPVAHEAAHSEFAAEIAAASASASAAAQPAATYSGSDASVHVTMGSAALDPATAPAPQPVAAPVDDDDPAVTRSVLLRLIAGVQGL